MDAIKIKPECIADEDTPITRMLRTHTKTRLEFSINGLEPEARDKAYADWRPFCDPENADHAYITFMESCDEHGWRFYADGSSVEETN